jgi:hypothetical protein
VVNLHEAWEWVEANLHFDFNLLTRRVGKGFQFGPHRESPSLTLRVCVSSLEKAMSRKLLWSCCALGIGGRQRWPKPAVTGKSVVEDAGH